MLDDNPHLLVTTDLSEDSATAFPLARQMARSLGGSITLVYAEEDTLPPIIPGSSRKLIDRVRAEHHAAASQRLVELGKESFGDELRGTAVVDGPPARGVVGFARKKNVDLIIIAGHGRHGLRGTLLGSVCQRILNQSPCPVLVLPRTAAEEKHRT